MNISKETTFLTDNSGNMTSVSVSKLAPYDVAIFVIHFLFGIPTNIYILWLIATGGGIANEFFTLNTSVCEIMFCLRSVFNVIVDTFPRLFNIGMFFTGFVITGRPLFQCLICVERYLAVVHPVTFLKFKPLRYRVAVCIFTWIAILVSCVICLQFASPGLQYAYIVVYTSQFLIFLSIQLFCCVAVLRALTQSGPGERGREREKENNMKRRAFMIILITTVTLIISYIPGSITAFLQILLILTPPAVGSLNRTCLLMGSFVQPLLYIHRVQSRRQTITNRGAFGFQRGGTQ